jgi:hypothetical protein
MSPYRLVRYLLFTSLALIALGWWQEDTLPAPSRLAPAIASEPTQTPVAEAAFEVSAQGIRYRVQPRYAYELNAVVVSRHHSDVWWDSAHEQWNDHINLLDLCVVWGESATSDAYRKVSFSNTQFECHWSWRGEVAFNNNQAANNHLVTADPALGQQLKAIRVGDQIRLTGWLADYTTVKDGQILGTRTSSDRRTDDGPGACEVLYVREARLLAPPDRRGRKMLQLGGVLLLLGLVGWFWLPPRFDS